MFVISHEKNIFKLRILCRFHAHSFAFWLRRKHSLHDQIVTLYTFHKGYDLNLSLTSQVFWLSHFFIPNFDTKFSYRKSIQMLMLGFDMKFCIYFNSLFSLFPRKHLTQILPQKELYLYFSLFIGFSLVNCSFVLNSEKSRFFLRKK